MKYKTTIAEDAVYTLGILVYVILQLFIQIILFYVIGIWILLYLFVLCMIFWVLIVIMSHHDGTEAIMLAVIINIPVAAIALTIYLMYDDEGIDFAMTTLLSRRLWWMWLSGLCGRKIYVVQIDSSLINRVNTSEIVKDFVQFGKRGYITNSDKLYSLFLMKFGTMKGIKYEVADMSVKTLYKSFVGKLKSCM